MRQATEVLERFHRTLIEEIQTRRPEYLTSPFTVAEIYQNLVPYGSHRDRIGVSMNGDYEDALLRLLAGEGGFLILDSEPALRDLRQELRTPNPNTGLYREYAAVDVRLNKSSVDIASHHEPEQVEDPANAKAQSTVGLVSQEREIDVELAGAEAGTDPLDTQAAGTSAPACLWCRAELPPRENLNFCPFCGTDLKVVPCKECGEELEPSWRFCIACGTEVSG